MAASNATNAARIRRQEITKMRVLKKILIGLGSLFLVLVALFAWVGVQSARFKHAEAPCVQAYISDLSRRWNVADVYDRSANTLLTQADSPEGRRAIEQFRPLGALTSIRDFELKNYTDGTGGQHGVFDFKADFQNGEAVVEVIVVKGGGTSAQVLGVHLTSIRMKPGAGGKLST